METVIIEDMVPPLAAAVQTSGNILEHINSAIPWDMIFVTYCFVFFDMFYGILVSTVKGEVVSRKMLKGLHNKIFILFVPVVGVLLKAFFVLCSLPNDWHGTETVTGIFGVSQLSQFPICFLLCLFVMAMEFLSFLENSEKLDSRAGHILKFIRRRADKDENIKTIILDDDVVTFSSNR